MKSCKLEYMLKNVNIKDWKRIVFLFDKDGHSQFHRCYIENLENFKNMKPVYEYGVESLMYEVAEDEDKRLREEYKKTFTEINQICVNNNTYPLFAHPSDIEECLKTREELLRIYDSEELNKFFNVKSIRYYNPPTIRDVYSYPAVFTKEAMGYSVTVPNIVGVVTRGDTYEDAYSKVKEMIKAALTESENQCMKPDSLEETKKSFPDKIVVMITVEIERS